MLPFLKHRDDGVGVGPTDPIERKPDEDSPSYDMLDAIAEDMLMAVEKKNKVHLKSALASLCAHIQTMDEEQDAQVGG